MVAEYITDVNGTLIWNPSPSPNETAEWEGSVINGYAEGEGVLKWLWDGKCVSVYKGSMKAGKPEGLGRYEFADGDLYEGQWQNGLRHGHGKHVFKDQRVWEGLWENDKRQL